MWILSKVFRLVSDFITYFRIVYFSFTKVKILCLCYFFLSYRNRTCSYTSAKSISRSPSHIPTGTLDRVFLRIEPVEHRIFVVFKIIDNDSFFHRIDHPILSHARIQILIQFDDRILLLC